MTQQLDPPVTGYPPPTYPPPPMPEQVLKPGDRGYQWPIDPGTEVTWPPARKPKRRRGRVLGVVGTILVIGVVRFAAWSVVDGMLTADHAPLRTPLQIGSAQRMVSGEARDAEEKMMRGTASSQRPQAGIYGRSGRPQYVLFAAYGSEKDAQQVLDAFGEGNDVQLGKPKPMAGGLVCASLAIDSRHGAICAWGTSDTSDGVVWAYTKTDVKALAALTLKAKADVEAAS